MSAGIERALSVFDGKEMCPGCDGEGGYWDDQTGQPDEPQGGSMITCRTCAGNGWVIREPCIACGAPITLGADEPEEHDEGCPLADHPGSLAVAAQALADKAEREVQR